LYLRVVADFSQEMEATANNQWIESYLDALVRYFNLKRKRANQGSRVDD
jgi:hypothetical protein